jgi:hypothetical protein
MGYTLRFNAATHTLRLRVERTFAWKDKFKRLLLRFERIQQRPYGMKLLAYTLTNLRAFCVPKARNQLLFRSIYPVCKSAKM